MVYVGGAKNENGVLINLTYNLINKYEHLGIGYPDETQSRLEHHTSCNISTHFLFVLIMNINIES